MPAERMTYRQIADDLDARIRAGEYAPGAAFPSYQQIASMYSVSVTTAQSAVRLLRDRGLLRSVSGVGTFVREPDDLADG